jgi:RimJ/RimL family protein N-acetyltransferase
VTDGDAGAPRSDLGWMALRAEALFVHDARGRIVASNDPEADPPRLFLGRTRCGALWRLSADLPDPLARELARLAAAERVVEDPERDPERLAVLCARLEEHAPIEALWRGPALRFPRVLPVAPDAALLDAAGRDRAAARFPEVPGLAGREPVVGVFAKGELAGVAYAATGPGRAVEVGVETRPAFRGLGLAGRAVATWARAVRARGRVPLYSARAENRASRRVAARMGLIAYGWGLSVR